MSAAALAWVRWRWQVFDVGVASTSRTGGKASSSTGAFCSKKGISSIGGGGPNTKKLAPGGPPAGFRPGPIALKTLVGAIAALGRLDPGELDSAAGDCVPIDVALELRYVDPVDRIVVRLGKARPNRA